MSAIRDRRDLVACLLLLLFAGPAAAAPFGFDDVGKRAQQLAAKRYKPPEVKLPDALRELGYDAWRGIRFRPDKSVWRGTAVPFELQFFHPGFLYQETVRINLVTARGVQPVPFDPDAFTYQNLEIDRKALKKLGYAGFRIHFPVNRPDYKDEVAVFLGASYFRGVGKGQRYGLSARGLAVDTAAPSGEEVPSFREFWIEWPAPDAKELVVYALLDSARLAGAYRFVIRPGTSTVMDVRARLYLRAPAGKVGVAPLTSMYFFGENHPAPAEDFRPEVHDSDGLSIAADNGEWIWRPLVNPRRLLVTSFEQHSPRGFGLMQRDRRFTHYEDLEARYELRPSAWVEPVGDWGDGRVELVQIPTGNEFNDNVVAYWVPAPAPAPGTPLELAYRLWWQMEQATVPPLGRVVQSRRGPATRESVQFTIDFEGGPLDDLPADAEPKAVAWSDAHAEVVETLAHRNDVTGGWRLVVKLKRKDEEPVELRAALHGPAGALTETWSALLPAP